VPTLTDATKLLTGDEAEILRWFNMRKGVQARLDGDILTLFFDVPCEHLLIVDGKATCLIHATKPVICRNGFNCVDNADFIRYRREKYGR
jgi:hypothetical protein